MSYQPVVPFSGYAGWAVLQRTKENQQEAFNASSDIQRDVDYFRDNISEVTSAEELVSNYRLLKVALGAFGLDDDINNKYFIERILDEGTLDANSLSNKLSDKRYLKLAEAFGFGNVNTPKTLQGDFPDEIVSSYQNKQFEIAVGEQDANMRLAMNIDTELTEIANKDTTNNGRWYSVMGNEAVRSVLETALGLPSSVSSLDLDQQLGIFRDKAKQYFGNSEISQFSDPENREDLVKLFLIRAELNAGSKGTSAASNALALLTGSY